MTWERHEWCRRRDENMNREFRKLELNPLRLNRNDFHVNY